MFFRSPLILEQEWSERSKWEVFHRLRHLSNLSTTFHATRFAHILKRTAATRRMRFSEGMDSLRLYGLVAAGGVALLGAYALLRRKAKTPDELERERRLWLEGAGRITDGTVIDVQELPAANNHHAAIMLIYKYDVAGVSYECSQDVTYLRHWINLHSCRLGLPTSVKYDPQNPGNSLVVSENWMGLRQ